MTWLDELKQQVESTSLATAAHAMGVSKTAISLLLAEKYGADTSKMQALVESVFMGHKIDCPILGSLPKHKCKQHQHCTHVGSQPQQIRLWKACRSGCPHSQLNERLIHPVRLTAEPTHQPTIAPINAASKHKTYDPNAAIFRLERQARTDAARTDVGNANRHYQSLLLDLLKREIIAMGNRYNRTLSQLPQKTAEDNHEDDSR
jgi:hypothetical protein